MDSNQSKITDEERRIRIDLIIHMKKQKGNNRRRKIDDEEEEFGTSKLLDENLASDDDIFIE